MGFPSSECHLWKRINDVKIQALHSPGKEVRDSEKFIFVNNQNASD